MSAAHPTGLESLRALTRYRTHGGYVWAAVLSDGELLCTPCARAEYRQVFRATRDGLRDGWAVVGLANSGEHDSDGPELCAHCGRVLWGESEQPGQE